ncbi:MAG: CD3324 family protein [Acetatifactor sp.]
MSYVRAEEILPFELIETIQQYVSGKSIYIPSKEKKAWGSQTKTRQYYQIRNSEICEKHADGISVNALAEEYSLTEKSIQRIIRTIGGGDVPNNGCGYN